MDDRWENTSKSTQTMREVLIIPKPGLGMLSLSLGGLILAGLMFLAGAMSFPPLIILAFLLGIVCFFGLIGLFTVNPNEAKVLQLFGNYMALCVSQVCGGSTHSLPSEASRCV